MAQVIKTKKQIHKLPNYEESKYTHRYQEFPYYNFLV